MDQFEEFSRWQYENGVDFWQRPMSGKPLTIMVAPHNQLNFETYLSSANITYQVTLNDVEPLLEEERQNMATNRLIKKTALPGMVPDFSIYWSSTEMENYSTFLSNTYPQFVQMETLIFSPGGRRIYGLKISNGVFGQKPIIAMESGMHAREW